MFRMNWIIRQGLNNAQLGHERTRQRDRVGEQERERERLTYGIRHSARSIRTGFPDPCLRHLPSRGPSSAYSLSAVDCDRRETRLHTPCRRLGNGIILDLDISVSSGRASPSSQIDNGWSGEVEKGPRKRGRKRVDVLSAGIYNAAREGSPVAAATATDTPPL